MDYHPRQDEQTTVHDCQLLVKALRNYDLSQLDDLRESRWQASTASSDRYLYLSEGVLIAVEVQIRKIDGLAEGNDHLDSYRDRHDRIGSGRLVVTVEAAHCRDSVG